MKFAKWFAAAAIVASVTAACDASGVATRPRSDRSNELLLTPSATVVASEPGCNATAFAQLPGEPSLFIGRQFVGVDGRLAGVSGANDCSGGNPANEAQGRPFNRWGLVLDSFDWATKRFQVVKPLLDTSIDPATRRSRAVIGAGPFRGLILRSAYDPSVVKFGQTIFVAFECTFENGEMFGVEQTSSCLAAYDPARKSIDLNRAVVAVTGERAGASYHVASVPRLLQHGGKLYLYWSAMVITNGHILRSTARAGELDTATQFPSLRNKASRVPRPFDAASVQVWAPDGAPTSNTLVNIMSFANNGDEFFVLAVVGGKNCESPSGKSPGCHRLMMKRSRTPLAKDGFAAAQRVGVNLPTNPHEYALPVVDPAGRWWLLGHFVRPTNNGSSERVPAPGAKFWSSNSRPSTLALIPMALPQ